MKIVLLITNILILTLLFSGCEDDSSSSSKGSCKYYSGSQSTILSSRCYDGSLGIEECNSECYFGSGYHSCRYSDESCEERLY